MGRRPSSYDAKHLSTVEVRAKLRLMAKLPLETLDSSDATFGPYDGPVADPWFLPDTGADDPTLSPLPRADQRKLIDPALWAAAQAALSGELAHMALLYGALEERLRAGSPGLWHRLALLEAADLSWAVGDRISAERLGLWEAQRLSGVQDDGQALARASWAMRRLVGGGVDPQQGAGLAAFLGRQGVIDDIQDLGLLAADIAHLHPVTQAAALAQSWQMLGQGGPARAIEAAVLAGRIAAGMGRGGAGFVPQAMAGGMTAQAGSPKDRLSAWLTGASRATLAALLHLERVSAWQAKAAQALADLQGRTPALLLQVLSEWPMVTCPMAEGITGANKATVLRNLAVTEARGLVREVTGQSRYRVWTAKI